MSAPTSDPVHGPGAAPRPNSDEWLLARWRAEGDRYAREQLVSRLMPVAHRIAGSLDRHQPHDDLVQAAGIGLMRAIELYDETLGVPFRAYAAPMMHGWARRHIRDHGWLMRPPRAIQERRPTVDRASRALSAKLGRSPTAAELAADLDISLEEVVEVLVLAERSPLSLDAPTGDGDHLADAVGADDIALARAEDGVVLDGLRRVLDERERLIVTLYFEEDLTQREVARRVGISQMQVSRVLRRALGRMRDAHEARCD